MRFPQKVLLIVCSLLMSLSLTASTLAVLDFENNSLFDAEQYDNLSKGLAEMMITELSKVNSIQLVERRDLKSVLDEIKLAQSGVLDESKTAQVGKLLGAQNLVFGGFMVTMNNQIRIDCRIVEVETGLTKQAAEITGKTKKLFPLIQELSVKVLNNLEIKLSKEEKKALKKSNNIKMDAILLFSEGLDYEDQNDFKNARKCYEKALKIEPKFERAKLRIIDLTKLEKKLQ